MYWSTGHHIHGLAYYTSTKIQIHFWQYNTDWNNMSF